MNGWLVFHFLIIPNKTNMDILVPAFFCGHMLLFLEGTYLGAELLGHKFLLLILPRVGLFLWLLMKNHAIGIIVTLVNYAFLLSSINHQLLWEV